MNPISSSQMRSTPSPAPRWLAGAAMLGALWLVGHAPLAHGDPTSSDPATDAQRKACMDGSSGQDPAACLREIGAAKQDAAKGGASTQDAAALKRNATMRCDSMPEVDRAECRARINGGPDASTSGSVKTGGEVHEYRETVPATPVPAPAPPKPSN